MNRVIRYIAPLSIAAVALAVHGLLLFNDGTYWDDWLWITALRAKDWQTIQIAGFSRGQPLDAYFDWFFSIFQNVEFAHRVVAFLSILLTAILIYAVCRNTGYLSLAESLWVAMLSLAYPAFQTQILLSTTNYLFYFMLFLGAALLALRSEEMGGAPHATLRIAALLTFFVSYSLASLLALYLGFLILFVLQARQHRSLPWREILMRFLPRHLDYVVLPFLYWFVKTTWFPTYGLYKTYNAFSFAPSAVLLNVNRFLINGIYAQFRIALLGLAHQPALWFVAVLIAVAGWRYFGKQGGVDRPVRGGMLFASGLFLLALAMLPYVAVGLSPTITGWDTRHSLLLGLPVALLLVALARVISTVPPRGLPPQGWVLLAALLSAFGLSTVSTYVDWQARWVKDSSFMANLSHLKRAGGYSVYWMVDTYPLGGENYIQFYEYSSMFKQVWGTTSRIGYSPIEPGAPDLIKHRFSDGYNINAFNPEGCQAILTIRQGDLALSETQLVAHYFYYKFFHTGHLPGLLAGVTKLRIAPYRSSLATECHSQEATGP